MFGHKHEHGWGRTPVAGTVAESRQHGRDWSYVVDYRTPEGDTFRATVPALDGHNIALPAGTPVQIFTHHNSGEAKLAAVPRTGAVAPSVTIRVAGELHGQDRGAAVAAALAGLSQAGLGQPADGVRVMGTSEVRVVGGSEVHMVGGAQAAEVMEAVQELMSGGGSPGAARERIRHLKEDLLAQNGMPAPGIPAAPEGFNSPGPSTFDPVAEAPPPAPIAPTTFSSPAPSVGQPGPSFGQPGFSPVAPATTFSSPAGPGSFSAGSSFSSSSGSFGGFGETKSDRIAQLEDQRDRGQITPEQFAAQRQQIQDEI